MASNIGHKSVNHIETELVPYLEGKLSADANRRVEQHLRECSDCRTDLTEIRHIINALEKNKGAFCPRSSELYEFALTGNDPSRLLAEHLEECEACRAEYAQYCDRVGKEDMPDALWARIKSRLDAVNGAASQEPHEIYSGETFVAKIYRMFKLPALVTAAAAAALLIIFLNQPKLPMSTLALTSVTWENVPQAKTGGDQEKKTLAYLIFLEQFKNPVSQSVIDSLYRALVPDIDVLNHYKAANPGFVSNLIKKFGVKASREEDLIDILAKELGDAVAIVVRITPSNSGVRMDARLIDLESRKEKGSAEAVDVPYGQMEKAIQELAHQVLVDAP